MKRQIAFAMLVAASAAMTVPASAEFAFRQSGAANSFTFCQNGKCVSNGGSARLGIDGPSAKVPDPQEMLDAMRRGTSPFVSPAEPEMPETADSMIARIYERALSLLSMMFGPADSGRMDI